MSIQGGGGKWQSWHSFFPMAIAVMLAKEVRAEIAVTQVTFKNASSIQAGYSTTINPQITWGKWDGWGVSLCWWANIFGNRDDLADLLFTTNYVRLNQVELPGLGLNIARYNAGGCSFRSVDGKKMRVSPNIPEFKQIRGFWQDASNPDPESASWDWSTDANQRAMLQKAGVRGANRLELFSNSPMWWMCANQNPSGADKGPLDNLPPNRIDQHALYLATVVKYAKDHWGITFDSVEAFNEPSANWWTANGTQEGCHIGADAQAQIITSLRRDLDVVGLAKVKVAASDENTYDETLATWNSFKPAVPGEIGRVNTHGYQYGSGQRDRLYAALDGKALWNSEYGDGDASGMRLVHNLNLDFHQLHPTGWCYWQALDKAGWGLIRSDLGSKWVGPANPKYFVMAQYTRHIRPGMSVIDGGDKNTVAAYDPMTRKLVVVTANFKTPQWVNYNLKNFPDADGVIRSWITVTGSGLNYQAGTNLMVEEHSFRAWFPANAIQTFEIMNLSGQSK